MPNEYIEHRSGGYYIAGTRVSLDSIVYAFNEGRLPEDIREDFPLLKLSQVYGAIAFYLDHQADIDAHLSQTEREFENSGVPMAEANPALWERIQRARARAGDARS